MAKRRQEVAEQKRLQAQKQADNLAQKQDLAQSANRQAVNAGGAADVQLARKTGGSTGGHHGRPGEPGAR